MRIRQIQNHLSRFCDQTLVLRMSGLTWEPFTLLRGRGYFLLILFQPQVSRRDHQVQLRFRADQSVSWRVFLAEFSRLGLEMAESRASGILIKYRLNCD